MSIAQQVCQGDRQGMPLGFGQDRLEKTFGELPHGLPQEPVDSPPGLPRQSPEHAPRTWPGYSRICANFPKNSPRNLSIAHKVCQGNRQGMPPGFGQDPLEDFWRIPHGLPQELVDSPAGLPRQSPRHAARIWPGSSGKNFWRTSPRTPPGTCR